VFSGFRPGIWTAGELVFSEVNDWQTAMVCAQFQSEIDFIIRFKINTQTRLPSI
jgi:hypothetical protein